MIHKRVWSGVAVAAALALSVTACASGKGSTGGDGSGGNGSNNAKGNGSDIFAQLSALSAPDVVKQASKAVAVKQTSKVHMTMSLLGINETADGAAAYGDDVAMQMTITISGGDAQQSAALSQMSGMEVRMVHGVMYMKMGGIPAAAAEMGGKQWVKMDLAELAKQPALASFGAMKDMMKNNDPAQQMKSLLASPDLKKVGVETVNGVQALHYAGDVTPDDVMKVAGALTQQDKDTMRQAMQQAQVTNTHYDLWVNADGLPVEIKFSEDTKLGSISGDLTYSDWGAPVTVQPVPDSDSVDILKLMNQSR